MYVYLLELGIVRGSNAQDGLVHLGRSEPPLDDVLREVNSRIKSSEKGHRNLVPLHRRRASLLHEFNVAEAESVDKIVQLTKKYLLDSGTPVVCSLRDVFAIEPKIAIACLKKAHGRVKAVASRRASLKAAQAKKNTDYKKMLAELIDQLGGMHKKDSLPPLACDVLLPAA